MPPTEHLQTPGSPRNSVDPPGASLQGFRSILRSNAWQYLAVLFCIAFGITMILNTQMAGEGVWFWYTNAFRHGAKLYSDLHLAMQPLYILESDAWIRLFGIKCFVFEIPAAIHVVAYAIAIFLVLRESRWPDWQKAVVLASSFALCLFGHNYRLDDYHIVAEVLIFYSFATLLVIARTHSPRRQTQLAALLGLLSGLTITSRVTDGAALLLASFICLMFLVQTRRLILTAVFGLVAALTVLLIVHATGDTFAAYISSTLIKAAGSKGGTGSIFAAPLLLIRNDIGILLRAGKWLVVFILALIAFGAPLRLRWKLRVGLIALLQLALALAISAFMSHAWRLLIIHGAFIPELVLCAVAITYLLPFVVVARLARATRAPASTSWDRREVLVILPLAMWASASAASAGQPLTQYYAPVTLLLLLFPILQPLPRQAAWLNASFLSAMALVGLTALSSKVLNPYSWNDAATSPMFTHRVWYRHPVYGPLYIDRDDLAFNQSICASVGPSTELLGLPYPYANYFCAIPPWHGYVQTYFDTTPRATIQRLIAELNAAPPQWIVYQRQLHIMAGAEGLYNHGQPLAQRDLDTVIMQNIASHRWQLIQKRDYPDILNKDEYLPGDGWYLIRTRP
ncbi:MAG TPA: hypothetical protein VGU46_07420 [Acidobacteriaceae bacterium]|nr:hypothetical protein [Acidobacteriaceae bacterium]